MEIERDYLREMEKKTRRREGGREREGDGERGGGGEEERGGGVVHGV